MNLKEIKALRNDLQLCTLRYSPCGNVLVAGGFDGTVRRWDAATLEALPPLSGQGGWVSTLAFAGEGKRLIGADTWGGLRCWPYADREPRPAWEVAQAHDGWIRQVAVSPDGAQAATCGKDRAVRLWSVADGKKIRDIAHNEDVYSLAFHPDGKSLAFGDLKGLVRHWDLAAGKALRDFDARATYFFERLQDVGGVRCLAFDAQGATLACGGGKPKSGGFVQGTPLLLLFDAATGKAQQTVAVGGENDGYVYDLAWNGDGNLVAVTSGQPGSGKLFFHKPGEAQPFFLWTKLANCHAVALHPDGKRLAVCSTNPGSSGNGRQLKNGEYPGNWSPVHVYEVTK